MIVYLTHWFCARDRSRAIACLYAAIPAASLIGSPLAGWLLGVHWQSLAGWRWLFILEGIPAVVVGIITFFYMTDWPVQARWLPQDERDWLVNELQAELQAKKKIRNYTITEAFCDLRILRLIFAYFLALTGALGTIYWIPTFVKRLSGFSNQTVTSLLLIPALMGIAGMLINGWHSDRTAERHWHSAIPLVAAGFMFGLLTALPPRSPVGDCVFASGQRFLVCVLPRFLGDTDDDAKRSSGRRYIRTDQFNRATRRICRKLRDWVSQRSNALPSGQLRVHSARLCCGGRPDP